jgi:hypothetical protein
VTNQPVVPARVLYPTGRCRRWSGRRDLAVLAADEHGRFRPGAEPSRAVEVVRSPDAPLPWDASTHRVPFVPAGKATSCPGRWAGWSCQAVPPGAGAPASAILQGPEGPAVLAAGGEGGPAGASRCRWAARPSGWPWCCPGRPSERAR